MKGFVPLLYSEFGRLTLSRYSAHNVGAQFLFLAALAAIGDIQAVDVIDDFRQSLFEHSLWHRAADAAGEAQKIEI